MSHIRDAKAIRYLLYAVREEATIVLGIFQ